jgi:hypothetical protein
MEKTPVSLALFIGLCLGSIITGAILKNFNSNYHEGSGTIKTQCEENLPRNQFCEIIITAKPIIESGE